MKRWFAGISTLLVLGAFTAPGADAAENNPPADAKPDNANANGEASQKKKEKKKPAPKGPPPAKKGQEERDDKGAPSEGAAGKSPPPAAGNAAAASAKPDGAATVPPPAKPATTPNDKAGAATTAGPIPGSTPILSPDEAFLRDLEMLLLMEILNDYELFEDAGK